MSMHADEESDEGVVPMKRSNNEGVSSAETVEGRTSPKGNGGQTAAARTQRRDTASNGLAAVRQAARQSKTVRFTALLHHITTDLLKRSYLALARDAAPGTDGVTWQAYGESLEEKLKDLHDRVHWGSYRARPAKRTYIPKADGSKRPLSILCLEDKVVQQAVVYVLEAIYEEDFLGFSYGFRPGRGHSTATRRPVPEHVMNAVRPSRPPKQMLVVSGSPVATCSSTSPNVDSTVMPPFTSVATQTLPSASMASESKS